MRKLFLLYTFLCVLGIHAQTSKLSPFVRQAMMTRSVYAMRHNAKVRTGSDVKQPTITAFVRTTDTDVLRQQGCRIYAQFDDICIASIPLDKLSVLANMSQIQRIEAGESCGITNDTTAIVTRTKEAWQKYVGNNNADDGTSQKMTGKGVVVGVMDIGFDLTHPTFHTADGKTYRIKQMWDQLDMSENGEPVTGKTDAGEDTIYVGRQYIGTDSLLKRQHPADGFTQNHGTHTTGTAAGSGWEGTLSPNLSALSSYSGMAPEADICLVDNYAGDNMDLVPEEDRYKYTTATDMLGFKYIFDYAGSVGKPCVINFSEGAHDDMDECGLYAEVLSKMVGPGRILCASAGNEGNTDGTYMHKEEGVESKGAFVGKWFTNTACFVLRSQKPVNLDLSFYRNNVKVLNKNYDLTELSQSPDSIETDSVSIEGDTITVMLQTYPDCYDKNLYAASIVLTDLNNKRYGYATPTLLNVLGDDNDIEVFAAGGYFIKSQIDTTLTDYDNSHSILFPGSANDVICVGNNAYRTRYMNTAGEWRTPYTTEDTNGVISRYSSIGPALSGKIKPDVIAPGQNVISSFNSFYRETNPSSTLNDDVRDFVYNDRHYQWHALSGTSMSSPAVTGIIALWLQVCPTLTSDQIKDVFAHTCIHYDESLEYPNNKYGWGQIDAKAGLDYVLNTYTGIKEIDNAKLTIENADAVYTLDGRRVSSVNSRHGIFIVSKNGLTKKVVR